VKILVSVSAPFICLLLLGCPAKQSPTKQTPIGLWHSEKGAHTVEFFKDGSVRLTNVVQGPGGSAMTLPMGGTYTIDASNRMTVIFSNWPAAMPPVFAGLSNDVLYLQALSVNGEFLPFRRMR
jgi:hypothetical protein